MLLDHERNWHFCVFRLHSRGVADRGAVQDRRQFRDLPVQGAYGREHFWVLQQRGFVKLRLELMNEVNQSARAVNERHPRFAPDLVRGWFSVQLANARAFETIPDDLFATAPFHQPLDTAGDKPEFTGNLPAIMIDGINVERGDVAAFDI